KFMLVPTLGLNLVGFVDDDPARVGLHSEGVPVLGRGSELEPILGTHKVSEVFLAVPEVSEERLMVVVAELDRLGVIWHVVPRLYHLMSFDLRMENLDSIPLFTRARRGTSLFHRAGKRAFDLVASLFVLLLALPAFVLAGILIKRESPGPVFFRQ